MHSIINVKFLMELFIDITGAEIDPYELFT